MIRPLTGIGWLVVGVAGLAAAPASADWRHVRGNQDATNRAAGAGEIRDAPGHRPGISSTVAVTDQFIHDVELRDVDGDGMVDAILTYQGRLGALDLSSGHFHWVSPFAAIDDLVGLGDFDGDGVEQEALVAAKGVAGGLHVIDLLGGSIMGSAGALRDRSGVENREIALGDLDGDGIDEIVFGLSQYGLPWFSVANFGPGYGSPSVVELGFTGYANATPPKVGALLLGGAMGVVIDQGPGQRVFSVCDPGEPGAQCSPSPGQICLCFEGTFNGVYPTYAFGDHVVLDTDGDGVEEVLTIASDRRYTNAVTVLSFADGLADGSPETSRLHRWYRGYPGATPYTMIRTPEQDPVDLNGDGKIDVVVSFVNNVDLDVDENGMPIDDGIDLDGGVAVAVLDAATGEVQATLMDAVVHGWADLDGDGNVELITSPVSGWDFQRGLNGHELSCSGSCTLSREWSAPGRTLDRALDSLNGTGMPDARFMVLDSDEDGSDELLAYAETSLELLRVNGGGGVSVVASHALRPTENAVAVDAASGAVLTVSETELRLLGDGLRLVAGPVPIPLQGSASWFAAPLQSGDALEVPIFESTLYLSGLDVPDGAVELPPRIGVIEDLDANGATDYVTLRVPNDDLGEGFEVQRFEYDPDSDDLDLVWTRRSAETPDLVGLNASSVLHMATGDFDGAGARDIVFPIVAGTDHHLLVLDGDDGVPKHLLAAEKGASTNLPLLVEDLVLHDGSIGTDGLDDVVVRGASLIELLAPEYGGSVASMKPDVYYGIGANADVDGDGSRELVTAMSVTSDNKAEVRGLDFGAQAVWSRTGLGRRTGTTQVLSFADLDGAPGWDLLFITGDAELEAYAGTTGAGLPGFPVHLVKGDVQTIPGVEPEPLSAVIALDVDDDGHDEAIVGARDGWVYAVNIEPGDVAVPSREWSIEVGGAVAELAAGDVDGDGYQEVLVSTDAGLGLVIDSLGVELEIVSPDDDDCLTRTAVEVSGRSENVATVDLEANGVAGDHDISAAGGTWSGFVTLGQAPGEYELVARGRDELGDVVVLASKRVEFEGDPDGDGVSECGGDCAPEDASVHPDASEICGDGVDQDCDGEDEPCDDGGGSHGEGCDCPCDPNRLPYYPLVVFFPLLGRRPRRAG